MTPPDENGWMPIETAPKDGSSALCFIPLGTFTEPDLDRVLPLRWDAAGCWRADVYAFVRFEPSHWQPLPKPPVQS